MTQDIVTSSPRTVSSWRGSGSRIRSGGIPLDNRARNWIGVGILAFVLFCLFMAWITGAFNHKHPAVQTLPLRPAFTLGYGGDSPIAHGATTDDSFAYAYKYHAHLIVTPLHRRTPPMVLTPAKAEPYRHLTDWYQIRLVAYPGDHFDLNDMTWTPGPNSPPV